ncbi:hypothetical protein B0H14DRAFT_3709394 [Mycena olivaceomarginata]|nr:hypothetical protein B0H14DRAFT_3709394 [Mycena olivaceomarginata]
MGRPRIIGLAALTAIKEIYTRHADTYLLELQWWLAIHHDIQISISSLHETLERTGLTRKLLHKIAVERDIDKGTSKEHCDGFKGRHGENGDTPTTFNRRMDILFGEDCRNDQGRLRNILRGAAGMPLVVKYLQKIEWSEIEAELARPKLDRIIKELEFLSNEPTGKSKRKTPELSSDVEEVSPPKRIRTTSQGSVTIEDIDEGDHNFSPDEDEAEKGKYSYPYRTAQLNQYAASAVSRGDDSDVSMSSDDETGPSQKNGPGGKKSHITKQADRRRKNKRPAVTSSDPSAVDASGMLIDVDVQEIEAPKVIEGPTKDANHFGGKPFLKKEKAGWTSFTESVSFAGRKLLPIPLPFAASTTKYVFIVKFDPSFTD